MLAPTTTIIIVIVVVVVLLLLLLLGELEALLEQEADEVKPVTQHRNR